MAVSGLSVASLTHTGPEFGRRASSMKKLPFREVSHASRADVILGPVPRICNVLILLA